MTHLLFHVKENQVPPTYSSLNFFTFLSLQFSDIKNCHLSPKVELGPYMDSRLMYHVYLNQAGVYLFPYFSIFLSQIPKIIFLSHFSVSPTKLKLDTHMGKGLIYCVHQIQVARIYLFFYFSSFFCLSN